MIDRNTAQHPFREEPKTDHAQLVDDATRAMASANTLVELDGVWKTYVKPVYGQIDDTPTGATLSRFYAGAAQAIQTRMK